MLHLVWPGIAAATLPAQRSAAATLRPPPEVVLSDTREGVAVADFGLGDGGVPHRRERARFTDDGCVTPGGVRVACRRQGVKLTFPSGRELLVAPDGALHLRTGEVAGRYPAGVELLLGDGARVRITLAQARKDRLRSVLVHDGERGLQPWRRGKAARVAARASAWAGVYLACCGDGGDVYRLCAIGPLVVLDRVLVADDRRAETPGERLVLLTHPLRTSLRTMQRQHRDVDKDVRRAVTAIAAVADRSARIFADGAALRRAERHVPRWLLGDGFELQLALDGPLAPRLQLFAGTSPRPMLEWALGAATAAYLTNPKPGQRGKRWHGNGTRVLRVAPELQVRDHLRERQHVLEVLRRFAR